METPNKVVNLYLEANPNPNSLKFVANFMLVPEGKSYDFPDVESAAHAPLAKALFSFPHVERVFYLSNFVTITKSNDVDWLEIQNELKAYIKSYLASGKPLVTEAYQEVVEKDTEVGTLQGSEVEDKIKQILEEYIKPAVEQDGGAISFHSYHDGIVNVLLQGSCSGCPSATITLKAGIENLLKKMIPDVKEVVAEGV